MDELHAADEPRNTQPVPDHALSSELAFAATVGPAESARRRGTIS